MPYFVKSINAKQSALTSVLSVILTASPEISGTAVVSFIWYWERWGSQNLMDWKVAGLWPETKSSFFQLNAFSQGSERKGYPLFHSFLQFGAMEVWRIVFEKGGGGGRWHFKITFKNSSKNVSNIYFHSLLSKIAYWYLKSYLHFLCIR